MLRTPHRMCRARVYCVCVAFGLTYACLCLATYPTFYSKIPLSLLFSFSLRSVKPKKTLAEALSALVPITPLRNRSFSPLDEDNLILSPACTPAAKEVRFSFSFSDSICRSTFKRRYLCRVAAYRSCWDRRLHGVHVYGVVLVALLHGSPHEF